MTDRAIADVTAEVADSATSSPEQLARVAQRALQGNLAKEGEKLARQGKLFVRQRLDLHGNLVSDAELAALCIEHGLTIVSADSDFARFPQITWLNPLRP